MFIQKLNMKIQLIVFSFALYERSDWLNSCRISIRNFSYFSRVSINWLFTCLSVVYLMFTASEKSWNQKETKHVNLLSKNDQMNFPVRIRNHKCWSEVPIIYLAQNTKILWVLNSEGFYGFQIILKSFDSRRLKIALSVT